MRHLVIAAAIALAAPGLARAQHQGGSSDHAAGAKAGAGASMQMHEHMMQGAKQSMHMKMSGDVDRDFATMMRHHHQMGIRMAEDEVKNGKDPQMKALAQKIIESQKAESRQFDQWLQAHGGKASSPAAGHGASDGSGHEHGSSGSTQ